MLSIKKKYKKIPLAVKTSFWVLLCNIIQKGISILTVPIITRLLGASGYGEVSIFTSWCDLLLILCSLQMAYDGYMVGMKKYKMDSDRYTSSVSGMLLLTTTLVATITLAFSFFNGGLGGMEIGSVILILIWAFGQGEISIWFANCRYRFDYIPMVIATLFLIILTPVLKILFIVFSSAFGWNKVFGANVATVFPITTIGIIAFTILQKKGKMFFNRKYWLFSLVFNIPLIPFNLSQTILNQSDRIMIGALDSSSDAGLYSLAYSVGCLAKIMQSAINATFIPWQYKRMENNDNGMVATLTDIVVGGILSISILIVLFGPEIVKILGTKEFYNAIYAIPAVTVGIFNMWLTQFFVNVELYYEKNKVVSMSSICAALLNVILNYIFIPIFGYIAAAYTTYICYTINMTFHMIVAIKVLDNTERTFQIKNILLYEIIGIIVMALMPLLYHYSIMRYTILSCSILLLFLKRDTLYEKLIEVKKVLITI